MLIEVTQQDINMADFVSPLIPALERAFKERGLGVYNVGYDLDAYMSLHLMGWKHLTMIPIADNLFIWLTNFHNGLEVKPITVKLTHELKKPSLAEIV